MLIFHFFHFVLFVMQIFDPTVSIRPFQQYHTLYVNLDTIKISALPLLCAPFLPRCPSARELPKFTRWPSSATQLLPSTLLETLVNPVQQVTFPWGFHNQLLTVKTRPVKRACEWNVNDASVSVSFSWSLCLDFLHTWWRSCQYELVFDLPCCYQSIHLLWTSEGHTDFKDLSMDVHIKQFQHVLTWGLRVRLTQWGVSPSIPKHWWE